MRWPLGVVFIVYGECPVAEAASLARRDGFAHIDVLAEVDEALALPVGDRFSMRPRAGCSSGPAAAGKRSWEQTVADFRAAPGAILEPWHGSLMSSNEAVVEFLKAVPGLRINLDVGHVVGWGGDPVELLPYACHVQLRQAVPGKAQTLEGEVDIAALLRGLEAVDYSGLLSVEYFDLPERGWPLDDPISAARDFAEQVRAHF
jgi:sugar phosphate isomerase/epimerase